MIIEIVFIIILSLFSLYLWSIYDNKVRGFKRSIADLEYRNKELANERNNYREESSKFQNCLYILLSHVGEPIENSNSYKVKVNGREYELTTRTYLLYQFDKVKEDREFDKKVQESIISRSQEESKTTTGQK